MTYGNVLSLLKSPVILMLLLLLIALGWVGNMDFEEVVQSNRTYCEMVELHKSSGGEYGWPPYDSNIECPQIATPTDQPANLYAESTSSSSM